MGNVLPCGLEVIEFELQYLDCVHFWANTLKKDMESFISTAIG